MILHHGLNLTASVIKHLELNVSFEVGFYIVALSIVQKVIVHTEAHALHRNTSTIVHHIGIELNTISDSKFMHHLMISPVIESHGSLSALQLDVTCGNRSHIVSDACLFKIRQIVSHEVTTFVGPYFLSRAWFCTVFLR